MKALFEGLRVIEVASFVFAPGAGTAMSDFGAEVIHVEPPGIGDALRVLYQMRPLPECERNYCWMLDGRNKKSLVLDLKQPDGHTVLCDLVRGADVLITNYQGAVVEQLGFTWPQMQAINPRLIYAHATGYGECGAEAEKSGYDATAWWARSGMMDAVHPEGGELALPTAGMGDHSSSLSMLAGIAMALYGRERTGSGSKVSSSLMANGAWSNSIALQAALCDATPALRATQRTAANAMMNHYRCADARSLFLVMIKETDEFERFCTAIERPDLVSDPRFAQLPARRSNSHALIAILNGVFAAKPLAWWREQLDQHHITFGIIPTSAEVVRDAQMRANGVFAEFVDGAGQEVVSSPITIDRFPKQAPRLPPELGADSEEILAGLGYDEQRRRALLAAGVVGRAQ